MKTATGWRGQAGVSFTEYLTVVSLIMVFTVTPIYWLAQHVEELGFGDDTEAAQQRADERATMIEAMGGLIPAGAAAASTPIADAPPELAFTDAGVATIVSGRGRIRVTFERSSAALHSGLYIVDGSDTVRLLADNHAVAALTTLYEREWTAGENFVLFIRVNGSVWASLRNRGYSTYDHYSTNPLMCEITKINDTTWRLGFEDLPAWWPPDYDYNDTVVTVELLEE